MLHRMFFMCSLDCILDLYDPTREVVVPVGVGACVVRRHMQDTVPPLKQSHLVTSQQSVPSFPLAFRNSPTAENDDNNNNKVEHVRSNICCLLLSGADHENTADHEKIQIKCYNSMLEMREFIIDKENIPEENITMMSPYDNSTTDYKNVFESMKRNHFMNPYDGFLLYLVGHKPDAERGFRIGNDRYISLHEIRSLIASFASCYKIIIIKDMCQAELFDLLPVATAECNQVFVEWSSCRRDGKSYAPGSPEKGSTLFSHCIATGLTGEVCPINKNNCEVCCEYKHFIQNGNISYKVLQKKWVNPHMAQFFKITNSDDLPKRIEIYHD